LYHRSIWLSTGCDLELDSFEMPVLAQTAIQKEALKSAVAFLATAKQQGP
jgi:hypothetical protein